MTFDKEMSAAVDFVWLLRHYGVIDDKQQDQLLDFYVKQRVERESTEVAEFFSDMLEEELRYMESLEEDDEII